MTRRHDPTSWRFNGDFISLDGRRAVILRLTTAGRRDDAVLVWKFAKELVELRPDVIVAHSSPVVTTLRGRNPQHSNCIRVDIRPYRRGLRCELRASRWERHRIYQFRILDDREMGGTAQGHCPGDHARCASCSTRRRLPEADRIFCVQSMPLPQPLK